MAVIVKNSSGGTARVINYKYYATSSKYVKHYFTLDVGVNSYNYVIACTDTIGAGAATGVEAACISVWSLNDGSYWGEGDRRNNNILNRKSGYHDNLTLTKNGSMLNCEIYNGASSIMDYNITFYIF